MLYRRFRENSRSRSRRLLTFGFCLLGLVSAGTAITAAQTGPVFETATIKPFERPQSGGAFVGGSCHGVDKVYDPVDPMAPPPLGRCVFQGLSLRWLLSIAFKGAIDQGSDWTTSDSFNIEAKAENTGSVTEAELLTMLQNFVVTTFKVQFHKEDRQIPAFNLYVGKNGPRFKESTSTTEGHVMFGPGDTPGTLKCTAEHVNMSHFAGSLAGMAQGPVLNKTNLQGRYDFSFEWPGNDPGAFLGELQAELGLRIETTKTPVTYLIIDKAEKPKF